MEECGCVCVGGCFEMMEGKLEAMEGYLAGESS
jgi:hypothetical protein